MSAEHHEWLRYAIENAQVAELCLRADLIYASIFNSHQAVEKSLKAILISREADVVRTHSIDRLVQLVEQLGIPVPIEEHDVIFLDSTFMASRYPIDSILAEVELTVDTAERALHAAQIMLSRATLHCERKQL